MPRSLPLAPPTSAHDNRLTFSGLPVAPSLRVSPSSPRSMRFAAIAKAHKLAGQSSLITAHVRQLEGGIRRKLGVAQK